MTQKKTAAAVPPARKPSKPSKPATGTPVGADVPDPTPGTRDRILQAAIAEFAAKGFSGARTEAIARSAASNIRMLYHYFGNKEALYVEVLESVLDGLRTDELRLDFELDSAVDGMRMIFDFIHDHFAAHPELMSLLSWENLNQARYMKQSERIPERASPVIALLGKLLKRGAAEGQFRKGVDPLHLYVAMVSMAYFHKSNAFTLSRIFRRDLLAPEWQRQHKEQAQAMLFSFLAPPVPQ